MITVRWTAIVLSVAFLTAESQLRHPVALQRGGVSLAREAAGARSPAAQDTVRVLAALVQFRPDADLRTTGNGQFDLSAPPAAMPDPPPHDSAFFAGKLQFLSNYFRRASNGQLTVTGTILPGVVTLDDTMAVYSPKNQSNAPLAELFIDAWSMAVAAHTGYPFDQFDAFVLFHAGAGRDVDLVSLLGYDPTPNDIPSLYVNLAALRGFLGDPSFQGVPVPWSASYITNSLILPETESRVLDTGLGRDTLKLSINGIAAATLGSHLGLPDLFDVTTGRSGIGQFGLMDGAGIFAYNGLFPPEPSAWEKYYLGWLTPVPLAGPNVTITMPAAGLVDVGGDMAVRVPISQEEYYLIENRQRDPGGDGQRLTVVENGLTRVLHFGGDTAGFSFSDISGIRGSVIDVEDLDWAMPGTTLQEGFEGGGILVWHIDEARINGSIGTNSVNADPSRRGVDLEEADGSQDIGQPYELLQAGSGTEFGWPLDLWFEGNQTPVYANRFDESSFPNSLANSGARSLITVKDFSPRGAMMSVTVETGSPKFTVLGALQRVIPGAAESQPPTVSSSGIYLTRDKTIYALNTDGTSKTPDPDGVLDTDVGDFPVAVLERGDGRTLLAACGDSSVFLFTLVDADDDGVFESVNRQAAPVGSAVTSAPAFVAGAEGYLIAAGLYNGSVVLVDSMMGVSALVSGAPVAVISLLQLPPVAADSLPALYGLAGDRLFGRGAAADLPSAEGPWRVAGFVSARGARVAAVSAGGSRMVLLDDGLGVVADVALAPDSLVGLAVADLEGDGAKEILLSGASSLRAFNETGSLADGFPVRSERGSAFVSGPVIVDLDGDASVEILVATSAGSVAALGARGQPSEGFPLQGFSRGRTSLAVFPGPLGNVAFLGVSADGALNGFETTMPYGDALIPWSQEMADGAHRNSDFLTTAAPSPISSEFFPRGRVYNWPNPVYGDETRIRFYVAQDAIVTVKIYDLTGLALAELVSSATGGLDGEIAWNVKDIDSGVYLARVQASSQGRSEVAVIKIAVVK